MAPPVAPRIPPRPLRGPAAAGRGRQGDPRPRRGAAALPAPQRLARRGALDGGRRRPDRRGPDPARPAPAAGQPGPVPSGPRRGRRRRSGSGRRGSAAVARAGAAARRPTRTRSASFGHIVVDEVQDLSPMQLRMLARRSLSGSMTVVGDIAQATGPWAPDGLGRHHAPPEPAAADRAWSSSRSATGPRPRWWRWRPRSWPSPRPRSPRRARSASRASTPRSSPGQPVRARRRRVAEVAREEVEAVAPGRVAVLGPAVMLPELDPGPRRGRPRPDRPPDPAGDGLAAGLVVLPADEANGLEFDSVVVVEPSLIAAVGDDVGRGGPAGGHHTGLADALRGAHPADPAAGGRPRRAAAGRPALTWAFGRREPPQPPGRRPA